MSTERVSYRSCDEHDQCTVRLIGGTVIEHIFNEKARRRGPALSDETMRELHWAREEAQTAKKLAWVAIGVSFVVTAASAIAERLG